MFFPPFASTQTQKIFYALRWNKKERKTGTRFSSFIYERSLFTNNNNF